MKQGEASTCELARRVADQMGPITQAFKTYAQRWASEKEIQGQPQTFASDTKAIIKAQGERIRNGNTQLYPLADRL